MKLAKWMVGSIVLTTTCLALGQNATPDSAQNLRERAGANANAGGQAAGQSTLVRDPATGRVFRQNVVQVSVPTTTWETKPVTQTVYEPRLVTSYVPQQSVIYVPRTDYVLKQRVRGRWNPFRQPVYTYDYQPVTSWSAQVQTQQVPVTTQQWVAKQQTAYVSQPVQRTETRQQYVYTEIPTQTAPTGTFAMVASQPAPRFRLPILARQQMLPNLRGRGIGSGQLAARTASVMNDGLRPVSNFAAGVSSANYSAPLRTASTNNRDRNTIQTGMNATVLR